MTNTKLKIASRRSRLAMVQTLWVKDQLEKNIPNLDVSIEAMATQGDKILDVALAKIGVLFSIKNIYHSLFFIPIQP